MLGNDAWAKLLWKQEIANNKTTCSVFIISDWRFIDEYRFYENVDSVKVCFVSMKQIQM